MSSGAAIVADDEARRLFVAPLQLLPRLGGEQVVADVAPLRDGGGEIETRHFGALLFLVDLARPPHFDIDRFSTLFGLTVAEVEVCS